MYTSCKYKIIISIHVPTRGTTKQKTEVEMLFRNFNSRPHKGDDPHGYPVPGNGLDFNSRPHKGDDLSCLFLAARY